MTTPRRFVIGDLHGAHKALLQCLDRSHFNRDKDLLISLGDICDGWPEVDKCIEELLGLKNLKVILGNHDAWALQWMADGWHEDIWTGQGGKATMASYGGDRKNVPDSHLDLLKTAEYFLELDDRLFVHGGIEPETDLDDQDPQVFLWDRNLLSAAVQTAETGPGRSFGPWKDIFVGHTPTQNFGTSVPIHAGNVWALDTGCGWNGKLTIIDIDSHQFWQSDLAPSLYPGVSGRT